MLTKKLFGPYFGKLKLVFQENGLNTWKLVPAWWEVILAIIMEELMEEDHTFLRYQPQRKIADWFLLDFLCSFIPYFAPAAAPLIPKKG